MADLDTYANKYESATLERRGRILLVQFHTKGESLIWGEIPHRELPQLFEDIGNDLDNAGGVVILTGTGDRFIAEKTDYATFGTLAERSTARDIAKTTREASHMMHSLLDIPALVIGAVNGPVAIHSEIPLLSDVVIATDHTYFQEGVHFQTGGVPGDGMHTLYEMWLGQNRGRYFLLTGQKIHAEEALRLGLVGEVTSAQDLLPRAWEIAERFAKRSPLPVRHTRLVLTLQLKRALSQDLQEGLLLEEMSKFLNRPGLAETEAYGEDYPPWAANEDASR